MFTNVTCQLYLNKNNKKFLTFLFLSCVLTDNSIKSKKVMLDTYHFKPQFKKCTGS